MLTPAHFGLPAKFRAWRPGQLEAVHQILDCTKRFQVVCAPTGFGKSPMYMAAAKMSGLRTVVVTSTKGLQDQLSADFKEISQDIRGQSNFLCIAGAQFGILSPGLTVDMGPCKSGAKCVYKAEGCEYYDRYAAARTADLVTGNYAVWMYDALKGGDENSRDGQLGGRRKVDMLVLDEAHDALDQLAGFLQEELKPKDIEKAGVEWPGEWETWGQEEWAKWAAANADLLTEKIEKIGGKIRSSGGASPDQIREMTACKTAVRKLGKVAMMRGEWVIEARTEQTAHRGGGIGTRSSPVVQFDPLWPKVYAESALFRSVEKIVLVSATVRPKTLDVLGVPVTEARFQEYGSSFPIPSRPVIHVPTVQMSHRTNDFGLMMWLGMIDRILDGRTDRKGLIHTVSYQRAEMIRANSRHAHRMLLHTSRNRSEIVQQFKTSSQPLILVSPSMDTGYDFPYTECEFQIITKVPFPDNRAKVIKRRMETDKEYSMYMTAQVIVQMTGRGMRAADDRCETLVVDDNIRWFVNNNKKFFPEWWLASFQSWRGSELPKPLAKL